MGESPCESWPRFIEESTPLLVRDGDVHTWISREPRGTRQEADESSIVAVGPGEPTATAPPREHGA
jgi:hypothetical protein